MTYVNISNSAHIAGFDYNEKNKTLTITFKRNLAKYTYYDVPKNIAEGFALSISKSKYFMANIKNNFKFSKS